MKHDHEGLIGVDRRAGGVLRVEHDAGDQGTWPELEVTTVGVDHVQLVTTLCSRNEKPGSLAQYTGYSTENLKIHTGVPQLPPPILPLHLPSLTLPSYIPFLLEVRPLKSS